jgi:hypothetical protein
MVCQHICDLLTVSLKARDLNKGNSDICHPTVRAEKCCCFKDIIL